MIFTNKTIVITGGAAAVSTLLFGYKFIVGQPINSYAGQGMEMLPLDQHHGILHRNITVRKLYNLSTNRGGINERG
jgi:hypothetical protein